MCPMRVCSPLVPFLLAVVATAQPAPLALVPYRIPAGLPDAAEALSPADVRIDGWLGERLRANATVRLPAVDTEPLLAGFRHRPGTHPWIGEHIGKWLHAATIAWAYTGDPALREKLDRAAADLIQCQEPDGYLGTYVPEKRFGLYPQADWNVWSHKYNLMGLLTYYQYTGNEAALGACRKVGDLLAATFPAKRSILAAGTHVGMAATSVLEPVVLLYRLTGDERHLAFARYIVSAWDEPNGPKIATTLRREKAVNKTANGKAYEMLSNLVGLCELARTTGDRAWLEPVTIAWDDIVANRLYLTGSASAGELFQPDHVLPNQPGAHICETCVTTTWVQLNSQLLRLTGDAKYGDELERTLYNHLTAAQHPRGDNWCYYTALEGSKPYAAGINCCHSSGPRGLALAPQSAYLTMRTPGGWALAVSTFETSRARLAPAGEAVTVEQQSAFPRRGVSAITLHLARPATFAVQVRVPAWAAPLTAETAGTTVTGAGGWAVLSAREWRDGDRIALRFTLASRLIPGDFGNTGRAALAWGPFVLAYDQALNPGLPPAGVLGLASVQPPCALRPGEALAFETQVVGRRSTEAKAATFMTFADAGAGGGAVRVWLRAPGVNPPDNDSLLGDGRESRSRQGNVAGSIIDGDSGSFVVTFDGAPAKEDWFAVTLDAPITFRRVAFTHGRNFHDGGWFDASAGKPKVQVQREKDGTWETVGELGDYPPATASDGSLLSEGRTFTLRLPQPATAVAVRVIGTPASGDAPRQAFSSCAELQAFAE